MNKWHRCLTGMVCVWSACSVGGWAYENYEYFSKSQSLYGPTGNISSFSTKTLNRRQLCLGLHKFFIGIGYGIYEDVEIGLSWDLKQLTPLLPLDAASIERKKQEISFHSKLRMLKEERGDLFDLTLAQRRGAFYLIAGKLFESFKDLTFQYGVAAEGDRYESFFSLTRSLSYEQFICDYDPWEHRFNVGWRFLLSPEMKLDFFLTNCTEIKNIFFDNFVFGITITY